MKSRAIVTNRLLGVAALSGGAAPVIHILSGVSLRMGLAVAAVGVAALGLTLGGLSHRGFDRWGWREHVGSVERAGT